MAYTTCKTPFELAVEEYFSGLGKGEERNQDYLDTAKSLVAASFAGNVPTDRRTAMQGVLVGRPVKWHGDFLPPEFQHYFESQESKKGNWGSSLLHDACEHGDFEILSIMIQHVDNLEVRSGSFHSEIVPWETPLQLAARNGHPDIVKLMLRKGAEADSLLQSGANDSLLAGPVLEKRTPLFLAVQAGHIHSTRVLAEKGADPWWKNSEGVSVVDKAVQSSGRDLFNAVLSNCKGDGSIENGRNGQLLVSIANTIAENKDLFHDKPLSQFEIAESLIEFIPSNLLHPETPRKQVVKCLFELHTLLERRLLRKAGEEKCVLNTELDLFRMRA